WLGVKLAMSPARQAQTGDENQRVPELDQWECYELEKWGVEPKQALGALIDFMRKEDLERLITKTQILIAPPYKTKIANALLTNFHQPQSTLLLLIAALVK